MCFRSIYMCPFAVWTDWECEIGPTKEIVTPNGTEEGALGGVACAGMEKSQVLCCSCEIIGISYSC